MPLRICVSCHSPPKAFPEPLDWLEENCECHSIWGDYQGNCLNFWDGNIATAICYSILNFLLPYIFEICAVFAKVIVVQCGITICLLCNVIFSFSVNTDNKITIISRHVMLNMKIINLKHTYKFCMNFFVWLNLANMAVGQNFKVIYDVLTGDVYQHK